MVHYMVNYVVHMIRLNIHSAKTHLSRHLRRLKPGEVIVLCRRNVPIAEIRPLPAAASRKRAFGQFEGQFVVPDSFFRPLPEEILRSFEGRPV